MVCELQGLLDEKGHHDDVLERVHTVGKALEKHRSSSFIAYRVRNCLHRP